MSMPVGAQSLPAEILEVILSDVVESAIPDERSWTALTLTHVCGLFRRVALDCPKLWTCLSRKLGRPGLALIEACIERSKDKPLDVVIHLYAYKKPIGKSKGVDMIAVDRIARIVIPVCARWRRCSALLIAKTLFRTTCHLSFRVSFDIKISYGPCAGRVRNQRRNGGIICLSWYFHDTVSFQASAAFLLEAPWHALTRHSESLSVHTPAQVSRSITIVGRELRQAECDSPIRRRHASLRGRDIFNFLAPIIRQLPLLQRLHQ